jgi:hypothetical protein
MSERLGRVQKSGMEGKEGKEEGREGRGERESLEEPASTHSFSPS